MNEPPKSKASGLRLNGDSPCVNAAVLGSRLWRQLLNITPGYGGFVVVVRVTPHHGELESNSQGEGNQVLHLQVEKEEHLVPKPKILLAILSNS